MSDQGALTVAVAQYAPAVGDLRGNLEVGSAWVRRAAEAGAQLVVLPELATSGYTFHSEPEAAAAAEALDGDGAIAAWQALCRELQLYVVAGVNERVSDQTRFNSAVLLGPEGRVGLYRKAHLFFEESRYFQPGDLPFPVFDLPFGRVGMLVCYDLWFPEAARALALQGADLIAVPTNWVANFRRRPVDDHGWTMGNYAAVGVATQNQVFVAAADRIGEERGVRFVGCSCVVAPDGSMLAGPAAPDRETLLVVRVDLADAQRAKARTPLNHTLRDRRPDLYAAAGARVPAADAAAPAAPPVIAAR